MAEEIIKKALSIDLGESINNVKELKKYINQLQDSLVGLDKESEQWEKTSGELAAAQKHLNDVMNAGKKSADAAEGSYDALSKQMSELKKVWKATADEAERDVIGKQINSLNDQLKDLDATIGNHQRNVGNYGSALDGLFVDLGDVSKIGKDATQGFEGLNAVMGLSTEQAKAFNDTLNKMKAALKITEALAKVAKGSKEYTKAQTAANVATQGGVAGMKALKVAIASTGIGLLITGLAFLATNFDKVKEKLGPLIDKFGEFRDKALNVLKQIVSGVIGVGNVITQYLIAPVKRAIHAFEGLGDILKNLWERDWKGVKDAASNAWKTLWDDVDKQYSFKDNFNKGKEVGEQFYNMIASAANKKKAEEAGKETGGAVVEGVKKAIMRMDIAELLANLKEEDKRKVIEAYEDLYLDMQKELNEWQRDQDPLFKAFDDETTLDLRYDELKNAYEQLGKDTTVLDQWYADQKKAIWDEYSSHLADTSVEAAKAWLKADASALTETKKMADERIGAINDIGTALGNLGSLFEENTAAYKATSIAQALISTYLAANQVMATEFGGAAARIAAMAAVITAGLANVASILSVNPKGENSPGATAPTTAIPVIGDVQPISYTRNITSASEEERLNQPIRAFVVESEVTASQELALRREGNSTF